MTDCPVCGGGEYQYYSKVSGNQSASLCGRDAVQIVPASAARADLPAAARVDFDEVAERWQACGQVTRKKFTVDLDTGRFRIKLFPDGRAIISGTSDEAKARAVYDEYVGL